MSDLGLYIHIPFCPYRCSYCDFLLFTDRSNQIPLYVKTVVQDLKTFSQEYADREIGSIYLGGGTPSLLSATQVDQILSAAFRNFSVSPTAEITLEVNPETVSLKKLAGYREAGVNRVSLGVQALEDSHLSSLGRWHTAEEAEKAFQWSRKAGFTNVNADLLFGFPNQTLSDWNQALRKIFSWNSEHLSAYTLQVEEKTAFGKAFRQGKLSLPSDNLQRDMYESLLDLTRRHGYSQYEISNFAKPGFSSLHNQIYWNNEEYIGIGLGAVSYVKKKRFRMTRNLSKYLSGAERIVEQEILPVEEEMKETIMLRLRLRSGISRRSFKKRFEEDLKKIYRQPIERFEAMGLLEWKNGRLRLTRKSLFVSNEVLLAFF